MTQYFRISLFNNKRDNVARLSDVTWDKLCTVFQNPRVRSNKDGALFSPASFDPPQRAKVNAKKISLLVLDLDHQANLGTIKKRLLLLNCSFLISSTHSHLRATESNPHAEPRFRVVIPLETPIPANQFPSLWNYIKVTTNLPLDEAAKDVSRIFYTPSIADSSSPYDYFQHDGPLLNWQTLLIPSSPDYNRQKLVDNAPSRATSGHNVSNGNRNQTLFKIGKRLVNSNLSQPAIRAALIAENHRLCKPPLMDDEVARIAHNVLLYPINSVGHTEEKQLPIPLPESKVPNPELDEELFPCVWKVWLADISERLQCPPDYAAVAALVSAAALIGNRIRIRPKLHDPWIIVPNLWGAIVGPPGAMKTPAVNEGLMFFREIAENERAKFEGGLVDREFERAFNESRRAELMKEMKKASDQRKAELQLKFRNLNIDEPNEKRIWTADATVEKLGEILNQNPDGILLLRDELSGWLRSLERHGHEQDRAFFLESWNGDGSFTFDRIGRGKTHIKNLTISLLGTIQPSMIEPYYRSAISGLGDDGLIQRFQLLVYPKVVKDYRYIDRPPKGRENARASFEKLYSLSPKDFRMVGTASDSNNQISLQFDPEAQEFFQHWLTDLEIDLRSGTVENPALESHIAKYRSLMPSLSLIFHLLRHVSSGVFRGAIDIESTKLAASWCRFLQKHAEKLYTLVNLSEFDCAKEILSHINSGELASSFTARDIYGKHWKKLAKPDEVKRGLELLTEYRYLTSVQIETGGRTKTVFTVNSDLTIRQ